MFEALKNRICKLEKAMQMHHQEKEPFHYTYFEKEIIMLLSELLTKNTSIAGQLNKVEAEIVKKIADLQAAIDKLTSQMGDIELTAEQTASIEELQTIADSMDSLVPDEVPPAA